MSLTLSPRYSVSSAATEPLRYPLMASTSATLLAFGTASPRFDPDPHRHRCSGATKNGRSSDLPSNELPQGGGASPRQRRGPRARAGQARPRRTASLPQGGLWITEGNLLDKVVGCENLEAGESPNRPKEGNDGLFGHDQFICRLGRWLRIHGPVGGSPHWRRGGSPVRPGLRARPLAGRREHHGRARARGAHPPHPDRPWRSTGRRRRRRPRSPIPAAATAVPPRRAWDTHPRRSLTPAS